MGRADVLTALGEPPRPYRKTPEALHEADAFERAGLHVHYGTDAAVEFVEAFPAPGVSVVLLGLDLFAEPVAALTRALAARTHVVEGEGGCTFVLPELDVSLWRAAADDARHASVDAAEPGYQRLAEI